MRAFEEDFYLPVVWDRRVSIAICDRQSDILSAHTESPWADSVTLLLNKTDILNFRYGGERLEI